LQHPSRSASECKSKPEKHGHKGDLHKVSEAKIVQKACACPKHEPQQPVDGEEDS